MIAADTPSRAVARARRALGCWLARPPVFMGGPLLGLTVLYTLSIIGAWTDELPFNSGDPAWYTGRLMWNWHALRTAPLQFADSNIFYPLSGTAYYQHLVLPPTLLFGPIFSATGNPILAANVVLVVAVWLNGLAGGLLSYRWTHDRWAGFAGGAVMGFSPLLLQRLWGGPLVMIWWIPLALLAVDAYCWRPRLGTGAMAVICLWAQFVTALYLNFYAIISCLLYLAVVGLRQWRCGEACRAPALAPCNRRRLAAHGLVLGALFAVLVLPFALGYLRVAQAWGVRRELTELVGGSASPLSFLNADPWSWLYGANPLLHLTTQTTWNHEKTLFPGFTVVALAAVSAWRLWRGRFEPRQAARAAAALAICLVAVVLALGPYLAHNGRSTGLPLPYLPLHLYLPGFAAMRVPARFVLMAVPGLAVLAAFAVAALRGSGSRGSLIAWLAIGALLVESARAPYPTSRLVDVFAEDDLAPIASGSGPLVWLPIDKPEPENAYLEAARMVQNRALRPTVNGYAGFIPPIYRAMQRASTEAPADAARIFAGLGVRTVVLDSARLDPPSVAEWDALTRPPLHFAREVSVGKRLRVYELGAAPPSGGVGLAIANRYFVAGSENTLWIDLSNPGAGPWIDARPESTHRVEARWRGGAADVENAQAAGAVVPLYVLAGERSSFGVPVTAPSATGSYVLTVRVDGFEPTSREVAVVPRSPPTSRTEPANLSATVWLDGVGGDPLVLPLGGRLRLAGAVSNNGGTTWLAVRDDPIGSVRIGYRWLVQEQGVERELVELSGRIDLARDLYGGEIARFRGHVRGPPQAGCYSLRIVPVAEGVRWFDEIAPDGRSSVTLRVRVGQPSAAPGRRAADPAQAAAGSGACGGASAPADTGP
ncbi:MAG TPA: hypothetical protein VGQ92_27540 [Actinoplanes sp.]|nr:hypothetical protein [Actinoplanes sp.]